MGGALTYAKNVLTWLPIIAPQHQFIVYLPEKNRQKLHYLANTLKVQLQDYPFASTDGIVRIYFDQVFIQKLAHQKGAKILFSSTGFGTFWNSIPEVLLVRNPVYFDKSIEQKGQVNCSDLKCKLRRWLSLISIQRANIVLFPTTAMCDMVGKYINLSKKNIRIIPYGFDHNAFSCTQATENELVLRMLSWKEEGITVLLNVSSYAVHKNFETLIEALPSVINHGYKIKLVTTLSREQTGGVLEYDRLVARINELGLDETVVCAGYIPYEQLSSIYRAADVFVFPSFTESFGHPMVEAMASGLPVLAADTPTNREVCGTGGIFFDTFDPNDCAKQLHDLIADSPFRSKLALHAQQHAQNFSWEKHVKELVEVFEQVANV